MEQTVVRKAAAADVVCWSWREPTHHGTIASFSFTVMRVELTMHGSFFPFLSFSAFSVCCFYHAGSALTVCLFPSLFYSLKSQNAFTSHGLLWYGLLNYILIIHLFCIIIVMIINLNLSDTHLIINLSVSSLFHNT